MKGGTQMSPSTITLLFLLFAVVMFVLEKIPLGVTSMIVCVGLVVTGVLDVQTAFSGFIDSNVILFVAMFIVGGALFETGMANKIGGIVTRFAKTERTLITLHLLLALHEILAALIAQPVLVRQLLIGLEAQQDIVGVRVRLISIVNVIGGHQGNVQLPAHFQQLRVHQALFRNSVVLQLQEEIPFAETGLVLSGRRPGLDRKSVV